MKWFMKILVVLMLVNVLSSVALAEVPESLKGTWIVDAKATEERLKQSIPKWTPANAQLFSALFGYTFGIILDFDSKSIAASMHLGGKVSTYQLISEQNGHIKYISERDKGDEWIVSVVNDKNILIKSPKNQIMDLYLWKQVKLDPKDRRNDLASALEAYKTIIANIKDIQIVAITKEWDDEALLHDGRTIEVHRKVANGGKSLSQGISTSLDEYSLEAQNPDTGKTIRWSGERSVNPIMLDFVDGIPYVVVKSSHVFSNVELYGCPEIPYVFLRYEQETSKWNPVPRNLAPKALRTANLSPEYQYAYMLNGKRQTKEFISGQYRSSMNVSKRRKNSNISTAEIPENFDKWDEPDKETRYKNVRFKNDCRSPLPLETEVVLPPPQEVTLEILETNNYNPVRLIGKDEWSRLVSDKDRSEYSKYCKSLFKQADPKEPWLGKRFSKDSTGQKKVPYNKSNLSTGAHRLCDKDYILYYAHLELTNKMVITKYTDTGDMLYRISFQKPEEVKGFTGYIQTPTIRSEHGYLTFEWWHFRDYNKMWEVKRTLKVRLREPQ